MSKRILIIGCGQLGSRHLQAVASLIDVEEIYIVDPHVPSLEMGRQRLKEIVDINEKIRFFWEERLEEIPAGDLCIVATQARDRRAIIEKAVQLGYRRLLIEKVVTQSVAEYEALMRFCQEHQVKSWVNCKSRDYGIHQYIKSKLNPQEALIMTAVGGNHGLANNGIHEADLFTFYDGCMHIDIQKTKIDPVVHASKRGSQVYDFSGTLYGCSSKGSELIITFKADNMAPDLISVTTPSVRFIVDHSQKFAFESYAAENWKWKAISMTENWAVSHMTKKFAEFILKKDSCSLPTLEECYPAHEFILASLLPEANKLLNKTDDLLSVT